jgi:sec-independent protein translocase protein TatA
MLGNLTGWHLIIILAVLLLMFGAAKLPALAKSIGQSTRIFKSELKGGEDSSHAAGTATVTHSTTSGEPQPKP